LDPNSDRNVKFRYGAYGAGAGIGFKLPKLGHLPLPGAVGSSESFASGGYVYLTPQFKGTELAAADFNGGCCFLEFAAGAAWGLSGYAMTVGMDLAALVAGAANPTGLPQALWTAAAYIFFGGTTFGLQASAGGMSFVGYMHACG
jgi:hypothetical protein